MYVAVTPPESRPRTPESIGYALKRLVLGKPLITERLKTEKLSNPVALGVLSPDAISSSAYGTEEILIELLPYAGLAAFTLLLPVTGVILLVLFLVTGSYRGSLSHTLTALDSLFRRDMNLLATIVSETPGSKVPLDEVVASIGRFTEPVIGLPRLRS